MFSIFKKKKKPAAAGDLLSIDSYAPHSDIGPLPYITPDSLLRTEKEAPRDIKEFLQKASPDQYSQTFYDAIIQARLQEALEDLKTQKAERERAVIAMLDDMFAGDLILCRSKLEACRRERAQVAQELAELQGQYRRCNTPKKGGHGHEKS